MNDRDTTDVKPPVLGGNHVASRTYQHFWLYILAGLIFLALTYVGTKAFHLVEEKVAIKGYAR